MFNSINDTSDPNDLKGKKYLGRVVFNDDPLMIERIKVRITGMFEGPPEGLPWVARNQTNTINNGSDRFGSFNLPPRIGSDVTVIFQEGNPMYPMYEGDPVQTDERPIEGQTNYLYRYGHKDPRGNLFFVDTKGDADVQAYIKLTCGLELTVRNDGTTNLVIDGDVNLTAKKNLTATVTGNMSASVTGNLSMTAQGPATINSSSMVGINAPAITMTGPNVSLTGSGQVSITAPSVKIN